MTRIGKYLEKRRAKEARKAEREHVERQERMARLREKYGDFLGVDMVDHVEAGFGDLLLSCPAHNAVIKLD